MCKNTRFMYKDRLLRELTSLDNNPRTISDESFNTLCQSLEDNPDYFNARPLILSNRTGKLVIIAGNMRYKAAKHIGLAMAPTYLIEGLDEDREEEIILRDNINNGEWDLKKLKEFFSHHDLSGFGLNVDWSSLEAAAAEIERGENDPRAEFEEHGDFEFENQAIKPFKTLIVHFENELTYKEFQERLEIELTEKTRSTYFPPQERETAPDIYE